VTALDLRVYLVTDGAMCARRGLEATVRAAAAGGVTAVQLRDPAASGRQLHHAACALVAALAGYPIPVLVNDRTDVALAAGAAGVHLGQSDLPPLAARALAGPEFLIGWSITDVLQLQALAQLPAGTVDYLGVGPVYPTATKLDAAPAMGVAGVRAVCSATRLPVVGIGGIDATNAAPVMAAGAAGVAVVSAICAAPDPAAAAAELRAAVGSAVGSGGAAVGTRSSAEERTGS
jgi:thiamine-phosphate pyrophosphorylase